MRVLNFAFAVLLTLLVFFDSAHADPNVDQHALRTTTIHFERRASSKADPTTTGNNFPRKKYTMSEKAIAARSKTIYKAQAASTKAAHARKALAQQKSVPEVDTTLRLRKRGEGSRGQHYPSASGGKSPSVRRNEKGEPVRPYATSAESRKTNTAAREKSVEVKRMKAFEKQKKASGGPDPTLRLRRRSLRGGGGGGGGGSGGDKKGKSPKLRKDGQPRKKYAVSDASRAGMEKARGQMVRNRQTLAVAKHNAMMEPDTSLHLRRRSSPGYGGGAGGGKNNWSGKGRPPGSYAPYKKSPRQAEASRANVQMARDKKAEDKRKGVDTKLTLRRRSHPGEGSTLTKSMTTRGYATTAAQTKASKSNLIKAHDATRRKAYAKKFAHLNSGSGRGSSGDADGGPDTTLKLRRRSDGSSSFK